MGNPHIMWPYDEKPLLVFWETTKACLLECIHCRAEAITKPLPGELSTVEGLQLIDQVAEFGDPKPIMVFTGGDLLMRDDIWDLLKYSVKQGIRTAVAPSVTPLLTREVVKEFKKIGVSGVSISIDSPYPDIHDSIRGIKGTWERSIWAIREMIREGIRVQVNTSVMRSTVDGLADMVKLLLDNGVSVWEVFYLVPVGRAGKGEDLTPQEWEDVSHFLYEASKYGIVVRTTEGPMFRRIAIQRRALEARGLDPDHYFKLGSLYHRLKKRLIDLLGEPWSDAKASVSSTRDGRGIVFIAYDGTVYPSGFLPVPVGNVRVKSLVEIYRENPLMKKLRLGSFKGRCGFCLFNNICGGSRAKAFSYHASPLAEDPQCPYNPGDEDEFMLKTGIDLREYVNAISVARRSW